MSIANLKQRSYCYAHQNKQSLSGADNLLHCPGVPSKTQTSLPQSEFQDKLFTDTIVDWSRMKAGFDDMVAKYPDQWNLSAYARFACLAGDRATTRKLLERIGPEAMASLWRAGRMRESCADWARSDTKDDVLAD